VRRVVPAFCAFAACLAQTPAPAPGPQILAWYVDAPLTITVDAAGAPHLGVAMASMTQTVRNEVPAASGAGWTLAHAPVAGATCWRNGVHQSPGVDYTLAGNAIASASWAAGDVLACDYESLK
jgi:hypothetical protein